MSEVDVPLDSLQNGTFAINSHKAGPPPAPLTYTSCGDIPTQENAVTITLNEQNASGQSGWATLTARGSKTEVVLNISPGALQAEFVHIHVAPCGNETLGSVVYPLTSYVGGFGGSVSLVDVTLASLRDGTFAINSHKLDDPAVYTVCGNIPAMAMMGATPGTTMPTMVQATIVNFALPNLTVAPATTIVWTNQDPILHTTTSGENGQFDEIGWNSPLLSNGDSFSHTFSGVGTFPYTCRVHPSLSGTVTVGEASGQDSGTSSSSEEPPPSQGGYY